MARRASAVVGLVKVSDVYPKLSEPTRWTWQSQRPGMSTGTKVDGAVWYSGFLRNLDGSLRRLSC